MGHEIESKDKLILGNNERAWHGLGIVVEDCGTPTEIVPQIFPYTVASKLLFWFNGEKKVILEGSSLNVRVEQDGKYTDVMGLVSDQYKIVNPMDIAEFCEALTNIEGAKVKVETAGSIQNGKKLWFLLRGEAFYLGKGDEVFPYVMVSSGYDGATAFRVTPTTIRTVCSNTFHSVVPRIDTGELVKSAFVIRHTQSIMERIEEAKLALASYRETMEATKKVFETLAKKEVTQDQLKSFFMESYQTDYEEIPETPTNTWERNRKERATSAFLSFTRRFDDEVEIGGPTAWTMANAYSGLVQHDKKSRGTDDANRVEKRIDTNLFGLNQDRTHAAFQRAFRIAVAT